MREHAFATSGRLTAVGLCCIVQVLYSCERDYLRWLLKRGLAPLVRVEKLKLLEANCLPKLM
jgi:hypothetical protein